jgi:hypothetical protein
MSGRGRIQSNIAASTRSHPDHLVISWAVVKIDIAAVVKIDIAAVVNLVLRAGFDATGS